MATQQEIIRSLITPNGQTMYKVFSNTNRYYIDIYQRDYKWDKNQVETLLQDIELRFNLSKVRNIEPNQVKEDVLNKFKPYFLNTFLTCTTGNNVSIVDGQQRLTTFLIILIKLRELVIEIHEDESYEKKTISVKTLDKLIFEADDFDNPTYYKIYNDNRQSAFDYLLDNENGFDYEDETQKKILNNYEIISRYYNVFFKPKKGDLNIDVNKLTYYIYYLLEKLNIVEIKIEDQENVATIFEVVNDRGLGLKPYEILKGKFLGNLDQKQKEEANEIWVELQNKYYKSKVVHSSETDIDLDTFFKIYFRSKFADSEAEYKRFEDKYHYEMYKNSKILKYFKKFEKTKHLFEWVKNDFKYFAELHLRLRTTYDNEFLIFNKLLDQNQQYLLIMSSIELNDKDEKEKINLIAKKFDQFHTTLRLLDVYDSNQFQDIIFKINVELRNTKLKNINKIFDKALISYLEDESVVKSKAYTQTSDLYKWELFQNVRNRWHNFSKYVLMRVDRYLANQLDKPSFCSESLNELEDRFNKNRLKKYGMHLEHIYASNDKNLDLFKDENGYINEEQFKTIRNKLGMVLLLKDKQNISSNNDYYKLKVDDYATSNIIWNEILVGHIDSVDTKNFPEDVTFTTILPDENDVFPLDQVETRQKELFSMIKLIWGF